MSTVLKSDLYKFIEFFDKHGIPHRDPEMVEFLGENKIIVRLAAEVWFRFTESGSFTGTGMGGTYSGGFLSKEEALRCREMQ